MWLGFRCSSVEIVGVLRGCDCIMSLGSYSGFVQLKMAFLGVVETKK